MRNNEMYAGTEADGRVIFTPYGARVMERYGGTHGCKVSATNRGIANDEMPSNDPAEADVDEYAELNAIYAHIHAGGSFPKKRGISSGTTFIGEGGARAEYGAKRRSPDLSKDKAQALDGTTIDPNHTSETEDLNTVYASLRGVYKSGWLLTILLALLFVPSMCAQPTSGVIYGSEPGIPTIGATCQFHPWQYGTPNAFLTSSGQIIVCQTAVGSNSGVWALYGSFNSFQGPLSAVTMNGSDVTLYSTTLPPLAAGGCYSLSYGIGAGLLNATIKVKIDGTTISTPYASASMTGANISMNGVRYCNNPGTQSSQTLIYAGGALGFLASYLPNSTWDYSQASGAGNPGEALISTPTPVNLAQSHTLSLIVNQASGTVVPEYLGVN